MLRKLLPGRRIDSAGTSALVNYPADACAVEVASKHGLSLEGHSGRQFTAKLGREYELILVMEKEHLTKISSIAPELRGKTMLYGHWLNQRDIPDPYRKSNEAFESVYQLIEKSGRYWADKLSD